MLSLTPPENLTDREGRPYFLWDCNLTLAQFEARLHDESPEVQAYFLAKLMRQAKPDDVFRFVRLADVEEAWPRLTRYLGRSRPFWSWLLETWRGQTRALLRSDGFDVAVLRRSPQFVELSVSDSDDVCIVDLVAEPFAAVDRPERMDVGGTTVQVDSIQEILVAKLAALLGRTELRDLIDVGAILETGADLAAAVRDAPKKDAGFSVLTLAWVLESFETEPLALASGATEEEANRLEALRKGLVEQLTRLGRPE